ncbi:class I SAM-dependent methyltransferase [Paenibacillus sp. MSJ-34]|uniref:tRNA (adenine(22)-N(1))-methyltransferase n=1 Tax=Paenibacillus sp. MSJ-34 TaxID=2841529 RepID=UPI001C11EA33|nr:class I SAM-dependent methyltransferase [Paenibacillus sp. MSJ-34]MBU5440476.1 class I SAM-dependent methyltransferase [Paenibacillus sp. MSJ-34]
MKITKLSARLLKIAQKVPQGSRLADIGSDHALLPAYLVGNGTVPAAIAGEVNDGPLEAARKQVGAEGLERQISVRKGDGLAVIEPNEVDVVTIAGMGGALIVKILSAEPQKLEGVGRLVLQPNVGEDLVRRWLLDHDWFLLDEEILEEDGKIYEILTAVRAADAQRQNAELYGANPLPECGISMTRERLLYMGPYLLRQGDEAFMSKWHQELDKLQHICRTLQRSETEDARSKEREFRHKMKEIEEVLQCLQKDKP